jgi:hypothetical protein
LEEAVELCEAGSSAPILVLGPVPAVAAPIAARHRIDGSGDAKRLVWLHDGLEFWLTSKDLSLNQMETLALSTFSQVGK